VRDHIG
jgi:hypothetical protein